MTRLTRVPPTPPQWVLVYAEPLRRAVAAAGLTRAQLLAAVAERGLSAVTVVDIPFVAGETVFVRPAALEALAALLGVPPDVLAPYRSREPRAAARVAGNALGAAHGARVAAGKRGAS